MNVESAVPVFVEALVCLHHREAGQGQQSLLSGVQGQRDLQLLQVAAVDGDRLEEEVVTQRQHQSRQLTALSQTAHQHRLRLFRPEESRTRLLEPSERMSVVIHYIVMVQYLCLHETNMSMTNLSLWYFSGSSHLVMVGVASMVNTNTSTPILRLLSYLMVAVQKVSWKVWAINLTDLLNISRARDRRSSATV